jgi:hypothetical protein
MNPGMNRSLLAAAVLAAASVAGTASAQEAGAPTGPLADSNFSATAILTTDYRFRGISNSDGFAFQGSFDWNHKGFNLGVFGSNTVFSDNNVEIDLYGGYSWEWAGLNWRGQLLYYMFPGEGASTSKGLDPPGFDPITFDGAEGFPSIEANYFEVSLGISKTFETSFSPTVGLTYNYSPDFFGEDGTGQHIQLSLSGEAGWGLIPYANAGYQDVSGDEYSAFFDTPEGYDYWWYQVGLRKGLAGFTVDLSWVATEGGGRCAGPGQPACATNGGFETFYNDFPYPTAGGTSYRDLTTGSLVLTVSRTF